MLRAAEAVAPSLGVQMTAVDIHGGVEIERAIATFASEPDGGLIITPHPGLIPNRGSIILSAARHRLPAVYPFRYFATEGRANGLWAGSDRSMARGCNLCRSHSAGREARRTAGSDAGEVRVGNQPQGRQRDRIKHRARIAAPGQRGD